MKKLKHFNRAAIVTILTVGLSGLQSWWMDYITTDYGHEVISLYFFIEILILLLAIFTGFGSKTFVIVYLLIFVFEMVWFIFKERPISPDDLLMLIVGSIRIYIFIWLRKQFKEKK